MTAIERLMEQWSHTPEELGNATSGYIVLYGTAGRKVTLGHLRLAADCFDYVRRSEYIIDKTGERTIELMTEGAALAARIKEASEPADVPA